MMILTIIFAMSLHGSVLPQDAVREMPPEVAPNTVQQPAQQPATQSPQKVEVTRFSDKVTVIEGKSGKETVKFYNDKVSLLITGDRIRQGSGAISECRFEDDGLVRFFREARYCFGELSPERHVIQVRDFTRFRVEARDTILFLLPGGTRFEVIDGQCYLEKDANYIYIRNAGSTEAKLSGYLVPPESQVLAAGHTVIIPLYDPELEEQLEPITVREVAGMIVKTTGSYRFEEQPGYIEVKRLDAEGGIACVGGTRVYLEPGESVTLRRK